MQRKYSSSQHEELFLKNIKNDRLFFVIKVSMWWDAYIIVAASTIIFSAIIWYILGPPLLLDYKQRNLFKMIISYIMFRGYGARLLLDKDRLFMGSSWWTIMRRQYSKRRSYICVISVICCNCMLNFPCATSEQSPHPTNGTPIPLLVIWLCALWWCQLYI